MTSLQDAFRLLFPDVPRRRNPFTTPPILPADLFAFTAYLLDNSGAYHHIAPETGLLQSARQIVIDRVFRRRVVRAGQSWREADAPPGRLPPPPLRVRELWAVLEEYADEPIYWQLSPDDDCPEWWSPVIELFMIADEASQELGFDSNSPFFAPIAEAFFAEDLNSGRLFRRLQHAPTTLSTADPSVVCVMAKSRTPSVGCTLRSLSHHLALLPGQGAVRARWVTPPFHFDEVEADTLGLLLVPFPFKIAAEAFVASGDHRGQWGWFEVEQLWIPEPEELTERREFVDYILELVRVARRHGKRVDGVVLPELALDYRLFRLLARALSEDAEVDFLIAGVSDTREGRRGNFVAIAPFFLIGRDTDRKRGLEQLFLIREKHHRWKLTESQIEAYQLESSLRPNRNWWEHLDLLGRSLDLFVYRGDTSLTTMVCEDLARVDPCQSVLRSIGPNLVIALLMDGPQLNGRWPARYATVLADDPGSSVLTFTSLGLIERQNARKVLPQSSAIALWKDEANGVQQLDLPRDSDAIFLQLSADSKTEHTLDGRPDNQNAHRWVFSEYEGISARPTRRPAWVLNGCAR